MPDHDQPDVVDVHARNGAPADGSRGAGTDLHAKLADLERMIAEAKAVPLSSSCG